MSTSLGLGMNESPLDNNIEVSAFDNVWYDKLTILSAALCLISFLYSFLFSLYACFCSSFSLLGLGLFLGLFSGLAHLCPSFVGSTGVSVWV